MKTSKSKLAGWILSGLLALFLIGASGIPKFVDWPGKKEMIDHMGISADLLPTIGVIEITVALLFLIPRTSFIGAILVTGYLGGATMTHLRIGEPSFFPIIVGVVVWIALGLRCPEVFALAIGNSPAQPR